MSAKPPAYPDTAPACRCTCFGADAALNTKLRLLWIQIFCLQFHQIYRMVHRFVTISRHQKPSASFYRSTDCRKQSRGTSVDQEKALIRAKTSALPGCCASCRIPSAWCRLSNPVISVMSIASQFQFPIVWRLCPGM